MILCARLTARDPLIAAAVRKRSHAFSLIELMIVVGIIVLLTSLVLSFASRAREASRRVTCMNNLRVMGVGVNAYVADSEGALPWDGYAEGDRPIRPVGFWNDTAAWFNAIPKYAGDMAYCDRQATDLAHGTPLPGPGQANLLSCPDATEAVAGPKDDVVQDGFFLLWGWDPAAAPSQSPTQRKTFWCYGFNTQLDGGIEDRHVGHHVFVRANTIPSPAFTALLVEKLMRPNEFDPPYGSSIGQSQLSYNHLTTRHDGGGYILMVDGHVSWFSRQEVLDAPNKPYTYNIPGKLIWNPRE